MADTEKEVEKPVDHMMLFPYNVTIFGLSRTTPCEVQFKFTDLGEGKFRIEIDSLTYDDEQGQSFDMMHLIEDEDDAFWAAFIINCIYSNKAVWDNPEWWWRVKGESIG